jgi:hypothetical protein
MTADDLAAVTAERDHYRDTLTIIAHLEDSPSASAHIAARALGIELPSHLERP